MAKPIRMTAAQLQRAMTKGLLEEEIQQGIVNYLRLIGWREPADLVEVKHDPWRNCNGIYLKFGTKRKAGDHQGTMQTVGAPDLQICPKGHNVFYGVEVKREKGKPSDEQEVLINAEVAHVVRSTTDMKILLDRLEERRKWMDKLLKQQPPSDG